MDSRTAKALQLGCFDSDHVPRAIRIENAYKLGANAFLVKPALHQQLSEMMKAVNLFWLGFNEFNYAVENSSGTSQETSAAAVNFARH